MSSKEFLNELVRRFPEQPKTISSTQKRVLELLAEWNVVYSQNSRYKEDFKHINDMCRLLEYKGKLFLKRLSYTTSNKIAQQFRT